MRDIPNHDILEVRCLPQICPACAHKEVKHEGDPKVRVLLRCQRTGCGWSQRYRVKRDV